MRFRNRAIASVTFMAAQVEFIDDHKAEMECEMEQVFKSEQESENRKSFGHTYHLRR